MTTQICTTLEQSNRLLRAGVNPQTADMTYHHKNSRVPALEWELRCTPPVLRATSKMNIDRLVSPLHKNPDGTLMTGEEVFDKIWGKDIPAWSLSTLLGMMPRRIDKYILSLNRFELGWYVAYKTDKEGTVPESLHEECYDGTLFDVVIRMIEWLIKNGHFDKKWLYEEGGNK